MEVIFCNKCGTKLDNNSKFCVKCGNRIINNLQNLNYNNNKTNNLNNNFVSSFNNQYNNQYHTNQSNNNFQNINSFNSKTNNNYNANNHSYGNNYSNSKDKSLLFIGIGAGTLCFIVVIILVFVTIISGSKYYFYIGQKGDDVIISDDDVSDENIDEDDSIISNTNSNTKGKYTTCIVYDNVYEGVKISNKTDAIKLIEKDSVSQKDSCPEEMAKIEKEIVDKYSITAVNLCEMDVDFARELGNVFGKIYTDFPAARGSITNFTLVNNISGMQNAIAAFIPMFTFATANTDSSYPWVIKTQIVLNSSYFLNTDRLQSSVTMSSDAGHFPKNTTIYSPVAHELGHYLSFLAMMKYYSADSILLIDSDSTKVLYSLFVDFQKGDHSLKLITEAYEKYKKDTNSTMGLDEWRGTISQYALAKDNNGEYIYDETIAESVHDVYLNGDNASEASKYIYAVLKEKLKR